jgi:hypothetical protein
MNLRDCWCILNSHVDRMGSWTKRHAFYSKRPQRFFGHGQMAFENANGNND